MWHIGFWLFSFRDYFLSLPLAIFFLFHIFYTFATFALTWVQPKTSRVLLFVTFLCESSWRMLTYQWISGLRYQTNKSRSGQGLVDRVTVRFQISTPTCFIEYAASRTPKMYMGFGEYFGRQRIMSHFFCHVTWGAVIVICAKKMTMVISSIELHPKLSPTRKSSCLSVVCAVQVGNRGRGDEDGREEVPLSLSWLRVPFPRTWLGYPLSQERTLDQRPGKEPGTRGRGVPFVDKLKTLASFV